MWSVSFVKLLENLMKGYTADKINTSVVGLRVAMSLAANTWSLIEAEVIKANRWMKRNYCQWGRDQSASRGHEECCQLGLEKTKIIQSLSEHFILDHSFWITFQICDSFKCEFSRFRKQIVQCSVKTSLPPMCLTDVGRVSFVSATGVGQLLQSVSMTSARKLCMKTPMKASGQHHVGFNLGGLVGQKK